MTGRLLVLGIGPEGEELYRHVLRTPGLALTAYVARLGWTDYEADHALEQLRARRLVRTTEAGELHADHPRASLERVLNAEEARLATRRQDLARVRDAIDQFAADHRMGQSSSDTKQPARERVDASAVQSVHEHLAASTVGTIRIAHTTAPDPTEALPVVRQLLEGGREQRALYVPDAAQGVTETIQGWAAAGEQQRVAPTLPSRFVCFGQDVALGTTEWGKADGDFVVLRDPMVVSAFVELFDRLWVTAAPHESDGQDASALIELMQQGLKDEAIARVLGISLRTVRRRIAGLMDEHGVDTRFQLAIALAERGGLPGGKA
ncbi:helix-turn-helix domain-containing protein [Luteipulveratus mongoliensis]|uniref:helix-turn-helix domain-containing protein n=1 Tax=Luteipulveratus mongoliensis TaxID=571913 RepID=UPI000698DEA3|nr:helix-turn-helix domain-containing protein [Luteipulveratus mongoliensis]